METEISHDRRAETPEEKVRWFSSLSVEERMEYLDEIVELALSANPPLLEPQDAEPIEGRVQVLGRESGEVPGDR
jgi:hypothetical protein